MTTNQIDICTTGSDRRITTISEQCTLLAEAAKSKIKISSLFLFAVSACLSTQDNLQQT